jgi:fluoride ion exporter CrcB/FEX
MEFRKLDIKTDENWFKRTIWTTHGKKTLLYILLGAIGGFLFYLISDDVKVTNLNWNDVLANVAIGAFFGFFLTNSPCARNKC